MAAIGRVSQFAAIASIGGHKLHLSRYKVDIQGHLRLKVADRI